MAVVQFHRTGTAGEPTPEPPPGPALRNAATRAALRLQTAHAFGIALGGLVLAAAVGGRSGRAGGVGLVICAIGVACVLNAARIWWILRRHPWQALGCRFREVPGFGNGSPTLVLTRPEDGGELVLSVVSFKWRWRALRACDRADIWMAGDPARGGVVAPPGGKHLLWARRPIRARRRESLRRATLEGPSSEGLGVGETGGAQLDQPG